MVIMECSSLSAKWRQLSGYLGLPKKNIDIINDNHPKDSSTCLCEALSQWIKQNYNTERFGSPSWRSLLKAVEVIDRRLFKKLASEHQLEGTCSYKQHFSVVNHFYPCDVKSGWVCETS